MHNEDQITCIQGESEIITKARTEAHTIIIVSLLIVIISGCIACKYYKEWAIKKGIIERN